MPITKTQERAVREAIKMVKQRPASLNEPSAFDPLNSIGVTREQWDKIQEHMRDAYDLYTSTWVVPVLESVLPKPKVNS